MKYFCNSDDCFNAGAQPGPGNCTTCGGPLVTTAPTGESVLTLVEGNNYISMPLTQFERMDEQQVLQLREALRANLRGNVLNDALFSAMEESGIDFSTRMSVDGTDWFDVRKL